MLYNSIQVHLKTPIEELALSSSFKKRCKKKNFPDLETLLSNPSKELIEDHLLGIELFRELVDYLEEHWMLFLMKK